MNNELIVKGTPFGVPFTINRTIILVFFMVSVKQVTNKLANLQTNLIDIFKQALYNKKEYQTQKSPY